MSSDFNSIVTSLYKSVSQVKGRKVQGKLLRLLAILRPVATSSEPVLSETRLGLDDEPEVNHNIKRQSPEYQTRYVLRTLNGLMLRMPVKQPDEQQVTEARIQLVLPFYLDFLEAFAGEVTLSQIYQEKDLLISASLSLLHHPLMFMDLRFNNGQQQPKVNGSSVRKAGHQVAPSDTSCSIAMRVLVLISSLEPNLYKLYDEYEWRSPETVLWDNCNSGRDDSETPHEMFPLSLGVAGYLTIGESFVPRKYFVPCVYSSIFEMERHLPFVHLMLEKVEPRIHEKGLILAQKLISKLGHKSLSPAFCDVLRKHPMDKSLVKVMVYSSSKRNRQAAVGIYKQLIRSFRNDGRYQMVYSTICEPHQVPGVIGLLLNMYRDFMSSDPGDESFTGSNLIRLVEKAVTLCLPDATETDLAENHETILETLNLIRFLCIQDSKSDNRSHIWHATDHLKKRLLTPLKTCIELSRTQFVLEIKKLEMETSKSTKLKRLQRIQDMRKMDIKIMNEQKDYGAGDQSILDLPDDHEQQVVRMELVKIDLVESVLNRVTEILE